MTNPLQIIAFRMAIHYRSHTNDPTYLINGFQIFPILVGWIETCEYTFDH